MIRVCDIVRTYDTVKKYGTRKFGEIERVVLGTDAENMTIKCIRRFNQYMLADVIYRYDASNESDPDFVAYLEKL